MIQLAKKEQCTGCSACYSICPVHCISMREDSEGFLYPAIDEGKCSKCGECEKICPVICRGNERKPLHVYAAKNPNEEIRRQSSSGGIFTLIAEAIIQKGGVVFGARFNEKWEVTHDYTETIEGLAAFRGSKYVQSNIGDTYAAAEKFLKAGKEVLFSGTPCQIAGLKAFLQKDYDNLLTVDLVCHGVPSPLVWKRYLDEFIGEIVPPPTPKNNIVNIAFRDKVNGWNTLTFVIYLIMETKDITNIKFCDKRYGWNKRTLVLESSMPDAKTKKVSFIETADKNPYMKGFLQNLYLRPSCYECPCRSFKSGSDITIADYWGIQNYYPEFDDNKGVSLVMVNSEKGKRIYELLHKTDQETSYNEALAGNFNIEKSVRLPVKRALFFEKMADTESIILLINKLTAPSLKNKIKRIIAALLRRLGLLSLVKSILRK